MPNQDTLYSRWLSGDLTPEEEKAMTSSGEIKELEAIIKASDGFSLPQYSTSEAFEKLKNKRNSTKTRSLQIRWIMGIAASIAILVAAYFIIIPQNTVITATYANNQTHLTKDNSTIVLNDGSALSYDESEWDTKRELELTGEALFEVSKGVPFLVKTKNGHVEVLGTSFNVRAWGEQLIVECYSGRVRVDGRKGSIILTKGEGAQITDSDEIKEFFVNNDQPLWRSGRSQFRNEPLMNVFKELERQYNLKVESPVFDQYFNGAFVHDDLRKALDQICKPMDRAYEINANGNVKIIK